MMFCKHEWELISDTTTESQLELMHRLGRNPEKWTHSSMERKYIQVFVCKKCGKLRRFVEII